MVIHTSFRRGNVPIFFAQCKNLRKPNNFHSNTSNFCQLNITLFLNYMYVAAKIMNNKRTESIDKTTLYPFNCCCEGIKVTDEGSIYKQIQRIVVPHLNTHAKYQSSTCNSAKVMAKVKIFVTDRQMDGQTDE